MGRVSAVTLKNGETQISVSLKTIVGPGMREEVFGKLAPLSNKSVWATINLENMEIDSETGEVRG